MSIINSFKSGIFKINEQNFESFAIELFRFQVQKNAIYNQYITNLGLAWKKIKKIEEIPFMPISFFKHHKIIAGDISHEIIFESSGTTGERSKHYIDDLSFYEKVSKWIFSYFYKKHDNVSFVGLLPSYLERGNSSLVFMVDHFMKDSPPEFSGFYLDKLDELSDMIKRAYSSNQHVFLFGVTFALLDFAERYPMKLNNVTIIETGGMKGRKKEMTREEVHKVLREAFQVRDIHSEYGMTELLSQAYAMHDGIFQSPPWMKVLIRDLYDPFSLEKFGKAGGINIIDLANIHSCAFIETQDIGVQNETGFMVLGRTDSSELRGCNLLLV